MAKPVKKIARLPLTKDAKSIKKARTITDQVELINWLVQKFKSLAPELMGIGEVRCFDCIADEFRMGIFPDITDCAQEYLEAVFKNVADQEEKVLCSPQIRWLSAEILAYAYRGNSGCSEMGAQYFIALLSDALSLNNELLIDENGETSSVTSTDRFRHRFGFMCDVTITHGERL
ncbi:hypothetical protein [Mesorhizobium sp. M0041]|uniref:hypothetical protein n=1 Tax=Mesorhizobium sp. M0041 TaxID=2956856 RepID=UPI0033352CDE